MHTGIRQLQSIQGTDAASRNAAKGASTLSTDVAAVLPGQVVMRHIITTQCPDCRVIRMQ